MCKQIALMNRMNLPGLLPFSPLGGEKGLGDEGCRNVLILNETEEILRRNKPGHGGGFSCPTQNFETEIHV